MKSHTKRIVAGIILILGAAVLYYAVSPLFNQIERNDAIPSPSMSASSTSALNTPTFPIHDTPVHPAEGSVRIVDGGDETIVRFENYKTINGPDLHVYLAKDLDAKEYIDLGPIQGTEGNINYSVPEGVSIEEYRYVLTWCEPFGVLFNYADIQP